MFKGLITALATPFKNGKVDYPAFENFIDWQVSEGVSGIVVGGTTGESATLEQDELSEMIKLAIDVSSGRIPVIVGTGTNSTKKALELTLMAQNLGAAAVLIVAPYYNKPTQVGLYEHYKFIHDQSYIPIILYNAPSRVIVDINDKTLEHLIQLERIAGIKDCSNDIDRAITFGNILDKHNKTNFSHLTGDDPMALAHRVSGGMGCISVTSNIMPKILSDMQSLMESGDFTSALKIHKKIFKLHNAMFCETNPAPIKYALSLMGIMRDELRLPLTQLTAHNKQMVEQVLKDFEII